MRSLGAHAVIDHTRAALPADGRYDVILDLAGNRPLRVLRRAQIGSITGGVAAGVVVFGTILIIAVFFYLMLNFPQGSIGPIA